MYLNSPIYNTQISYLIVSYDTVLINFKYDKVVYYHNMSDNKVKVTASMDADLVKWIDKEVESRRFASRTHALEVATSRLRNEIEKGQA